MSQKLQLQSFPALLIIDMQNGFCHPSGSFAKIGMPVSRHLVVVPAINRLRSLFHQRGFPVVFTREGWNEDYSDSGILLSAHSQLKEMKAFVRGTWDFDIIDQLTPDTGNGEIVVNKTRNSAFWGTDLDKILRKMGVNQLVAVGVGTNVCVESTVRDAITNDFHTVTVSDATATVSDEEHLASLTNLKWFGGTATTEQVEEAIHGL